MLTGFSLEDSNEVPEATPLLSSYGNFVQNGDLQKAFTLRD